MNLFETVVATASRDGSRPALTDLRDGRTLRYRDVLERAERAAGGLRKAGVHPGHRLAIVADNTLAHVAVAFGALASGACLVPIAATLRPAECDAVYRDIDVNAVVRTAGPDDPPQVEWIDAGREPHAGFTDLDAAFVRFTSGTTAECKGVILTHDDVLARVAAVDRVLRLSPADRILWTLPLAYHFAVTIVGYVRAGAHVLLASETLPAALVDAAIRERATVLYGSPVQFERMARAGRRGALAARLALSTAAPLAPAVADAFEAAFGAPLGQAYGIIEAGLPCINTRADGAPATSVGPAVPGYEVAVVDDRGHRVAAGVPGEVRVRGPGLFSGYYRPWKPRAAALRDGWLATGDVGRLDDAGRLTLLGRTKSTIIVAGMKVFPEEVEACLDRVAGVAESRVFGFAHPRLGEVPYAEIVVARGATAPEPAALARACARELSSYKVPVEFRVVDALPKTAGGKLLRRPS